MLLGFTKKINPFSLPTPDFSFQISDISVEELFFERGVGNSLKRTYVERGGGVYM